MLQCPNLLRKFGKATLSAVSCLAHNWFKVLLLLLLCTTLPAVSVVMVLMVSICQDYACYFWIKNLPVFIATAPLYLITVLLLILYLRCVRNTRVGKWFWNKTLTVTQLAFGSFFEKKGDRNNEEGDEEKMFTVFGHEASLKEMCWLFIILVQATLLAFAQFWDEFLLEESYGCSTHPKVHCFLTNFSSLSGQPMNCSDTSNTGRHVIVCYKYVFNIGHAAASAIGIISATGLIIYTVCLVFLKVLNGIRSHKWLITCIKLLLVAEIVLFWQVLDSLQMIDTNHGIIVHAVSTEYYATVRSFCKTVTMNIMIVSSILSFPWSRFRKSECEHVRDE